jgi:hypothetical protein
MQRGGNPLPFSWIAKETNTLNITKFNIHLKLKICNLKFSAFHLLTHFLKTQTPPCGGVLCAEKPI